MANTTHFKTRLAMLQKKADLVLATAEREQRALTDPEKADLTALEKEIDALAGRIEHTDSDANLMTELDRITGGRGTRGSDSRRAGPASLTGAGGSTPGALFASNEAVRQFIDAGGHRRAQGWTSPSVEIPHSALDFRATTLTENPASGGKLVVPQYVPGIVPIATRPTVIVDLLMPGTTDSNAVVFMMETAWTNAAAPVLEGGTKPESALTFDQKTEPVIKIATWLPVTEELLEDVPAISAYIDGRLRLGVQLAEDDQLLNGNGTPPNLLGLLNRPNLATTVVQGAGESAADAILRQIGAIQTTALVPATGIILHPNDWYAMLVLKTSGSGEYLGANPFESPTVPTLWGLPVAITPTIPPKTALVGAFATQVQWFRKGGLRLESTNAHQDWFVKNILCVRCEERGALCVYRPGSLGKVTLL